MAAIGMAASFGNDQDPIQAMVERSAKNSGIDWRLLRLSRSGNGKAFRRLHASDTARLANTGDRQPSSKFHATEAGAGPDGGSRQSFGNFRSR